MRWAMQADKPAALVLSGGSSRFVGSVDSVVFHDGINIHHDGIQVKCDWSDSLTFAEDDVSNAARRQKWIKSTICLIASEPTLNNGFKRKAIGGPEGSALKQERNQSRQRRRFVECHHSSSRRGLQAGAARSSSEVGQVMGKGVHLHRVPGGTRKAHGCRHTACRVQLTPQMTAGRQHAGGFLKIR